MAWTCYCSGGKIQVSQRLWPLRWSVRLPTVPRLSRGGAVGKPCAPWDIHMPEATQQSQGGAGSCREVQPGWGTRDRGGGHAEEPVHSPGAALCPCLVEKAGVDLASAAVGAAKRRQKAWARGATPPCQHRPPIFWGTCYQPAGLCQVACRGGTCRLGPGTVSCTCTLHTGCASPQSSSVQMWGPGPALRACFWPLRLPGQGLHQPPMPTRTPPMGGIRLQRPLLQRPSLLCPEVPSGKCPHDQGS